MQAKISIQLIALDKATKQSRDLVCVYVFIHNTSKSPSLLPQILTNQLQIFCVYFFTMETCSDQKWSWLLFRKFAWSLLWEAVDTFCTVFMQNFQFLLFLVSDIFNFKWVKKTLLVIFFIKTLKFSKFVADINIA